MVRARGLGVQPPWNARCQPTDRSPAAPAELLDAIRLTGMDTLPVTALDAVTAAELPMHHGDQFDRMLVAQAQRLDALIVSRDGALHTYDVDVLPA